MQALALVLAGPLKAKPVAWPCSQYAPLIWLDLAHQGTLEQQQAPPGVFRAHPPSLPSNLASEHRPPCPGTSELWNFKTSWGSEVDWTPPLPSHSTPTPKNYHQLPKWNRHVPHGAVPHNPEKCQTNTYRNHTCQHKSPHHSSFTFDPHRFAIYEKLKGK